MEEHIDGRVTMDATEYRGLLEELEYLQYFFSEADFGPADDDVRYIIKEAYKAETGKEVPDGY